MPKFRLTLLRPAWDRRSRLHPPGLLKTLHAPTRWLARLILPFNPDVFQLDLELIEISGRLSSRTKFEIEAHDFAVDHRNQGFWRGKLRQRVSTHHLRRLFRKVQRD